MGGEWEDVQLDEICDDITVGHVGLMAGEYVDQGVPFLRSLNIRPFGFNMDDLKYISGDFHARLRKSALKPGDVVIVRTGRPGACAVIPDWLLEANCSDLVVLRPGRRVRPDYIAYVVNTAAGQHILAHTVGAVQQHFNVGSARTIRVRLPSLYEQDRMLNLLLALDGKVEVNRRIAATLEAMARALFKSWFVNFDPVHARVEGRPTGLPDNVAALFPHTFGGGGLPKGWSQSPLSHFFLIYSGGTPKTSVPEYWSGDIPWFSIVDTPSPGSVFALSTEKSITKAGLDNSPAQIVEAGSTIISARGTIGKLAVAGVPMTFNQSCYGLRGLGSVGDCFVFLAAQNMTARLKSMSHGSVFSTITRDTFAAITLPKPPDSVLVAFDQTIQPLFARLKSLLVQTQTVSDLRDTLLPKLISGELQIADAEQRVVAA